MAAVRVGVPRTLAYYTYFPWWKTFLEALGAEVVVSAPTTKGILDSGIKEAVSDACVPIKLFHGHVADIKDKVHYLLVPRLVSVEGGHVFCPKFLGLPDMVRCSMEGLPPMIDVRVDLRKGRLELWRASQQVGSLITGDRRRIVLAYLKAGHALRRWRRLLRSGLMPEEALEALYWGRRAKRAGLDPRPSGRLRLAVLGYPYTIHDAYISVNALERLESMGTQAVTAEMIPRRWLARQRKKLPKDLFWLFSSNAIKAAYHFFEHGGVDGIIHITAFGCGPDSMVDKLMELEAKRRGNMPFMSLMIDEHTGEAGVLTRLEAFVDMVRRKSKRAALVRGEKLE